MLVSDGKNKTKNTISKKSVSLNLLDKNINFSIVSPEKVEMITSKDTLEHINGLVKGIYAEFSENTIVYTLKSN